MPSHPKYFDDSALIRLLCLSSGFMGMMRTNSVRNEKPHHSRTLISSLFYLPARMCLCVCANKEIQKIPHQAKADVNLFAPCDFTVSSLTISQIFAGFEPHHVIISYGIYEDDQRLWGLIDAHTTNPPFFHSYLSV